MGARGRFTPSAWYCWLPAAVIAALVIGLRAFPSLYGDEYLSLREAGNVLLNPHAVGYNVQLHFWKMAGGSDVFLRSLSLIWTAFALYWLDRWLQFEQLPARRLIVLLAATSPFLWTYFVQVRFYSFFLAASILVIWRFRVWSAHPARANTLWLGLGAAMVCTAHLFGALVLMALAIGWSWERWPRLRYAIGGCVALGCALLPVIGPVLVNLVFRMTNPYSQVPHSSGRGLSVAMLAKIPVNVFFFTVGERVYPLWWWLAIPAAVLVGLAAVLGILEMRRYSGIGAILGAILLSVPVLYLAFEPLAPPELQGGAPRYVIFTVPAFLIVIGMGAWKNRALGFGLIAVQSAGLACLLWPTWSYAGFDLIDWRAQLQTAAADPAQTCIVADGRSYGPVLRYSPAGTKIVPIEDAAACAPFPSIALVTNDYRPAVTRPFEDLAESFGRSRGLSAHIAIFPAELAVYRASARVSNPDAFSRLALPEQDLRFPLIGLPEHLELNGFLRLDSSRPAVQFPLAADAGSILIATSYRTDRSPARGTEVARVTLHGREGQTQEAVLRAGIETSAWNGSCPSCQPLASWLKHVHLVGMQSYRDAYRQYTAQVWGATVALPRWRAASIEVRSRLDGGEFYLWGVYPAPAAAARTQAALGVLPSAASAGPR